MKMEDIIYSIDPALPNRKDYRIGCIGAGFIMRDCHLVAYRDAGFNPVAITSLSLEESQVVASRHNIPKVYETWQELIADSDIEIVDIAIPPDKQLEVIKELVNQKDHIKGVLCQKQGRSWNCVARQESNWGSTRICVTISQSGH